MRYVLNVWKVAIVFLTGVLVAGCIPGNPSAPPRFYMLSPMVEPDPAPKINSGDNPVMIGIVSVRIPEYLNRPQIVTRLDKTELVLGEFDRWAEPLAENMLRVLVENLSNLLDADNIRFLSWRGSSKADYKLKIEVMRMDGNLGGSVLLDARWAVLHGSGHEVILMKRSRISEPVDKNGYSALVTAHSAAVGKLSEAIAADIRAIIKR